MEAYWILSAEWHKTFDAIHYYNVELECLPKCDYSLEREQELRERYTQKLKDLYAKLDNIDKQMEEVRIKKNIEPLSSVAI